MNLSDDIQFLKGVGPKKAQTLRKLNINTIYDLITYFPRTYEDQSALTRIGELTPGEKQTTAGTITNITEKSVRKGMHLLTAIITDGTGHLQVTWFNQKFLKSKLKVGKKIFVTGKSSYAFGGQGQFAMSQLSSYQIMDSKDSVVDSLGIQPVYGMTEQLNQKNMRGLIQQVLFPKVEGKMEVSAPLVVLPEVISQDILKHYRLMPRNEAFRQMHYPDNFRCLNEARRRLAFEELYLIQCGLMLLKKRSREEKQGIRHNSNGGLVKSLLKNLPFKLTDDQLRTWNEIACDMERDVPMRRLVQGDVGSGKTIISILALLKTVENGYQGAMMAPTEILATQHFESFTQLLEPLGVKVELLSGKLTKKKKEALYERLINHDVDIVVGTHALIQEGVHFDKLGLVVTDEQHRFGIKQRAELEKKGELLPDALVMTATPIPRTMTLTVYGDLDVSIIRQLPPGRKPVRTFVRTPDRRELIYKFMLEEIKKGRQGYVVCPLIELKDDIDLPSAQEVYEELTSGIFYGIPCGLVHGKMKPKEKDAVMEEFHAGRLKVLVATTVIEVGVNVPNASMMVIENAERFGLAQLHQLRGRIGRGEYASYCVLVTSGRAENSKERMSIMESTNDGFILAEEDLKLRGPGQFFGTMQHGLPDLKVADVLQDIDILLQAREAAAQTMNDRTALSFVQPILAMQYKEHFSNITSN